MGVRVSVESAAGGQDAFCEQMKAVRANRESHGEPWIELGISRRQWFRDRKSANENIS